MAQMRTLSKKTLAAVVCFSLLEIAVLLLIFLQFYPYSESDGSNMFGSVLSLPQGAVPDTMFLLLELLAAILPLSVFTAALIIADQRRNKTKGDDSSGGGMTKL